MRRAGQAIIAGMEMVKTIANNIDPRFIIDEYNLYSLLLKQQEWIDFEVGA